MTTNRIFPTRLATLAASLATSIGLAACGGGGTGSDTVSSGATGAADNSPLALDTAGPDSFLVATASAAHVPEGIAANVNVGSPATYYVDAINGNDSWAGTAPTAGGTNGPWRTLSRLATATLSPGDTVSMACGQTWNETLRFGGSGTAAAPIRVGAYPSGCATPPAIDGKVSVPASAWQLYKGQIYMANLNANQVPNGTLSQGLANWRQYSSPPDSQLALDNACTGGGFPCLRFTTGSNNGGSTLITPPFPVSTGVSYTGTLRVLVPSGVRFTVDLRRMTAPYTLSGLTTVVATGTGSWQTVSFTFVPGATVPDARLDIGVNGARVQALLRDASVVWSNAGALAVSQVFENNVGVTVAHHPNQGFNSSAPTSYYLVTAQPSDVVVNNAGRQVSRYLVTGSDLQLPAGASITAGLTVTLRSSDWSVGDYTVTSYAGSKLSFTPDSTYPLSSAGWGYYLTGALWMLDSPGEWFYDSGTTQLYVQTSGSGIPGSTLAYSALDLGADMKGKSYVTLQGLAFRRVKRGVDMSSSTGVQLQSVQITQTASEGVFAAGSSNPVVSGSSISDTFSDAIRAYGATGLQAVNNDISNSGVRLRADGSPATLPSAVWGAIYAGSNALVQNNRLTTIAFDGIAVGDDSTVSGNAVQAFCLTLNDCGAIHSFNAARQTIKGNLLVDGRSNGNGAPSTYPPHAVGIYIDVHTSASTVSGNTMANADLGLHVLDGYNNTFSGNLFYGNRQNQIWMQQRLNVVNPTQGDVFGNSVLGNNFFPTANVTSINQTSIMPTTAPMSAYDQNRYSALISPTIAAEANSNAFKTYSLPDWQAAVGPNGQRNLDINGKLAAPMAGRAVGIMGAGLIAPGNLQIGTGNGVNGWGRGGSPTAPTLTLGNCPVGITSCIRATAAPSNAGLMSSPKFPAVKNSWYRMSFDAAVSATSQGLSIVIRNATNNVTISPTLMANGSLTWKRYSFVFQATDDAPITPNTLGARIDFQLIQPNQWVTLSNLELVPMTAAAGDVPYTIIYNTSRATTFVNCPVTDAVVCASFYSYADSTPVTWPAALTPLQALAIFAPNASLVDTDNDGIADSQDQCPATPAGAVVNNEGCPLGF